MIEHLGTAVACREHGLNPADYDEFPLYGGGVLIARHKDVVEHERRLLGDGYALTEFSEGYIAVEETHYAQVV